jgi:hypothetical protein
MDERGERHRYPWVDAKVVSPGKLRCGDVSLISIELENCLAPMCGWSSH